MGKNITKTKEAIIDYQDVLEVTNSIGMYGNFSMEKFLKITTYIISMATPKTMILKILNVLQKKNTSLSMKEKELQHLIKKQEHITARFLGKRKNLKKLYVPIVEKSIILLERVLNFVNQNVPKDFIIKETGLNARVYDICIDGIHEFYANDILVHNCTWTPDSGASPNNMDALVWGIAALSEQQSGYMSVSEIDLGGLL